MQHNFLPPQTSILPLYATVLRAIYSKRITTVGECTVNMLLAFLKIRLYYHEYQSIAEWFVDSSGDHKW